MINSVTWQDSTLELRVLNDYIKLNDVNEAKIDVLIPGLIGDISFLLLTNKLINKIICVSEMSKELAILELKSNILKIIKKPEKRLKFIKGKLNWREIIMIFAKMSKMSSYYYWKEHQKYIIKGIIYLDRLYPLFKIYYDHIESGLDHEKSCKLAFSNRNIIKFMGRRELNNGLSCSFSKIFSEAISRGGIDLLNIPLYLSVDINQTNLNKLYYINQNILIYLSKTPNNFNLISLGNLTDQLCYDQLIFLIKILWKKTKAGGRVIFRRMTSDYPLRDMVNKYFIILDIDRDFQDDSYLFQEVLVATPRQRFLR